MTDLKKPDLSKDTTGPFTAEELDVLAQVEPEVLRRDDYDRLLVMARNSIDAPLARGVRAASLLRRIADQCLGPDDDEPSLRARMQAGRNPFELTTIPDAIIREARLALLQLEVDDQGVPVHGPTVRRVEL